MTRLLLAVLSFLLVLTVLWISLPRLIEGYTNTQLTKQGYRDIEFVVAHVGFQSATVELLRMSNDDFSIVLQDIKADYSFSDLISGSVDLLVIDHAELTRHGNNKSSSLLPDPLLLLGMLTTPWDEYMLARSLLINNLSLIDESGTLLLRSSFDINKLDRDLSAKISFIDYKDESHLMSLEMSAEKGIYLRLQSDSAIENELSPFSVSLQPAEGMDGLAGQFTIDLAGMHWLLPGTDGLSGMIQADISYLSRPDATMKDFAVEAEINDVQYESLQLQNSSIKIQGKVEGINDAYRIEFSEPSLILLQSIKQESLSIEKISMVLPQALELVSGKLIMHEKNGASLSLRKFTLDDIYIPEMLINKIVLSAHQTNMEQLDCKVNMQLEAPLIQQGSLKIKALPVQIDGVCAESKNEGVSIDAVTASLIIEDEEFLLPLNQCHAVLASTRSKKNTAQILTEYAGNFSCESSKQSGEVLSSFKFSPETGSGHADYTISNINPDDKLPLFSSLLKNWKEPYDLVTGKLSIKGKYRWWLNPRAEARENLLMSFKLKDGGGYYENVLFSGVDYSDQIEVLPFIKSADFAGLTVRDIDVGIPITSTKGSIRYSRSRKGPLPVITINSLDLSLLDGKVLGNDIVMDLNNDTHELILVVEGLDVSEIIELQKIAGLSVTGRLDGYVPLSITEKGIKITKGKIVAQPQGGQIHYRPEGGTIEMEKSALGSEFVFRIIDDLKYDFLDIDVDYKENGELELALAIKGKSPKVDEHRPVHFNLNLNQNVLKLLEGLRYAEGLSEKIDKNVQQHYSSGQRN